MMKKTMDDHETEYVHFKKNSLRRLLSAVVGLALLEWLISVPDNPTGIFSWIGILSIMGISAVLLLHSILGRD